MFITDIILFDIHEPDRDSLFAAQQSDDHVCTACSLNTYYLAYTLI